MTGIKVVYKPGFLYFNAYLRKVNPPVRKSKDYFEWANPIIERLYLYFSALTERTTAEFGKDMKKIIPFFEDEFGKAVTESVFSKHIG
ncbi:MAG TPA: hypothetical protein EYP58_02415 [bacterium (Candidatus Stahlbacteria)]|nr:hypothetical protein [Candidatus Stahlbacteria bacterium]